VVDWNNDRRKDLLVGSQDGSLRLYLNTGTDAEPMFENTTLLQGINVGYNSTPFVVDYDGDGRKDLIVGDSNGYIHLYLNIGTDKAPQFDHPSVIEANKQEINAGAFSAPFIVDYDNDGVKDLIIGTEEGDIYRY
jgi:WD40 repeat protein